MKVFLLIAGLISLAFGGFFTFSPEALKKFSVFCDQVVFDCDAVFKKIAGHCDKVVVDVDKKIHSSRGVIGIACLIAGAALLYFAIKI